MKFCAKCGQSIEDNVQICPNCGTAVAANGENAANPVNNGQEGENKPVNDNAAQNPAPQAPVYNAAPNQQGYQQYQNQGMPQGGYQNPQMGQPVYMGVDPTDHTKEMDANDIAENKIYAITVYVLGWVGIVIAALIAKDSKFVRFHIAEMTRLLILQVIVGIITLVLFFTLIVPAAGGVFSLVLLVVRVVGFVNTCSGKAKEIPLMHSFKFLV
ncbi:MAG: zinc-ribbon domain-containing protein [Butyrivibrio sp.]|uniref:zinc-ribbon domain-containing protein n=1 Tax=Butyrivibrio sp. NC2002 TaxID=1410610 RepID=UPI00056161CD|nr:zinc-ribbon domain-containing protein [Butyrivibrio sp. NC2002]MBE5859806.1 zinc-ribbon domain-containing protein [Butyrivibrio sp.]